MICVRTPRRASSLASISPVGPAPMTRTSVSVGAAPVRGEAVARLPRQQTDLAGLDLQREVPGVDAALGEAAGDEPEARLRGAREHVAQLLPLPESPDRTDARGDVVAEELPNEIFLALVAGRQHDEIRGNGLAVAHPRARRDEAGDIGKLHQTDLARDDQIGAADVEVVPAAAGEVLELPTRPVLAEIELEPEPLEPVEELPIELLRLVGQEEVALPRQREGHGRR